MGEPAPERDQSFSLSPSVRSRQLDQELILLDLRQGHYFSLNASGAAVWHGLERGLSLGAIDRELSTQWPVEAEDRWSMVTSLVEELLRRGLVEPRG